MKNLKKLASLLLALAMVMSLATTAFAAEDTYSVTINNDAEGHTYEAYQIFVGELSNAVEDDNGPGTTAVLSNVQWGASVTNAAELGSAAEYAKALAEGVKSVEDLIAAVELGDAFATSGNTGDPYVINGLEAGYYLIKDVDGTLQGEHDSYTEFILEVVEDSTVSPKSSVPEVQKKVKDINDSTETKMSDWQDSADHDIGDEVPFQLKATLANNVSAYACYKVIFHDTMSKGLTYERIDKVTIDGKEIDEYEVDTVKNEDGTTKLTITIVDAKAQGADDNSVVIVEYTGILNEDAVLGSRGNPNEVYLEYSNNPNWKPEYWDDDENPETPDVPKNPEDSPTGETPEDKVIVFTYKVVVNKVDEMDAPLAGAGFTLYKKNVEGEYVQVGEELVGEALTTFEWKGVDDGEYKLVETTTPAGYNTIAPIEFTVSAEHEILSDDPALTELDGGELFTGEVSTGALSADVENKSGITLPETGGMGTTLFYAFGSLLVLCAVVLLVTKRRMAF